MQILSFTLHEYHDVRFYFCDIFGDILIFWVIFLIFVHINYLFLLFFFFLWFAGKS